MSGRFPSAAGHGDGQLGLFDQAGRPRRIPYQQPGFSAPGTSQAAAEAVASRAATVRDAVLQAFHAAGHAGLTADEAAARVGEPILTVRPRCTELLAQSLIVKTDRRRRNDTGKAATVMIAAHFENQRSHAA